MASLTKAVSIMKHLRKATLCKIPWYLFTAGYKVEPISTVWLKYNWVRTWGGEGRYCLGSKLLQIRHSFPEFYFLSYLIVTENPISSCYNYTAILFWSLAHSASWGICQIFIGHKRILSNSW